MSNVDYKKKYFKLKGLVAKSLGAIERISDLDQMEGGGSNVPVAAEVTAQTSNLESKASELKNKLQGFVKGLQDSNEEAATTFNDKMGEQAGTILSKLVNVADELIKTVGNLQQATSSEIADYTTKLITSANNVITEVNNNLEALQKVSIQDITGGDDGVDIRIKEDVVVTMMMMKHMTRKTIDNLVGGYSELTFYDN